jgi:hypothetical protein
MKKIILVLALISTSLFAGTEFNTVKVSDGKVALCKTKYDLYRSKTGVYSAKATSVTLEEGNISFEVNLKFLACVEENEVFKFVYKKPYAKFQWPTLNRESTVTTQANDVRLKAFKDGVYKVLTNQLLEDEENQTKTITVSLSDVLNNSDSEIGKGSFDFWIVKKMNYTILNEGVDFNDLVNFGSYRIRFEVKETVDGLKAILL